MPLWLARGVLDGISASLAKLHAAAEPPLTAPLLLAQVEGVRGALEELDPTAGERMVEVAAMIAEATALEEDLGRLVDQNRLP